MPGIYSTLEKCLAQTDAYAGSVYEEYPSLLEAQTAFQNYAGWHDTSVEEMSENIVEDNTPRPQERTITRKYRSFSFPDIEASGWESDVDTGNSGDTDVAGAVCDDISKARDALRSYRSISNLALPNRQAMINKPVVAPLVLPVFPPQTLIPTTHE